MFTLCILDDFIFGFIRHIFFSFNEIKWLEQEILTLVGLIHISSFIFFFLFLGNKVIIPGNCALGEYYTYVIPTISSSFRKKSY